MTAKNDDVVRKVIIATLRNSDVVRKTIVVIVRKKRSCNKEDTGYSKEQRCCAKNCIDVKGQNCRVDIGDGKEERCG